LFALALGSGPAVAPAQGQPSRPPSASGVLQLTAAATGEEIESTTPGTPAGGIAVEFTIANGERSNAEGVELRVPIPARTRVADARLEAGNRPTPTTPGQNLVWSGLTVRSGEQLGPFVFRLVPEPGADGAKIFRPAEVEAQLSWSGPTAGRASGPLLRLNGLWGEGGLRRTVLANGLTIFTRERPDSRTVAIRLAVRAGSRDEDETTSGGSHWLEHAHFLGTQRREVLDEDIDEVGGQSNASTGWEHTDYWWLAPAEHFDLMVDLLSDQILHSTFLMERFERERAVVFEELKRRNDTPNIRAFDEFINVVFQVSPLRRHPAGTIESVQAIPVSTMLAYRDRRYFSGNMAIAVSGNLRHADAVEKITRAFAGLPVGARSERPVVPEPVETSPRLVVAGDGNRLAEVRLGWPAPGDEHPDAAAVYVLADLLGTTGRRLAEEIRDRRTLATSVDIDYLDFSDAGALMVAASTQPDRVDAVVEQILEQIRRVREGQVSEEEVQDVVRALAGRQAIESESNQSQTRRAVVEVSGRLDSREEYLGRLREVRAADVQRVANTYFSLENYTLVIVRM
jgi:predicted Zn-dependent peptidase